MTIFKRQSEKFKAVNKTNISIFGKPVWKTSLNSM